MYLLNDELESKCLLIREVLDNFQMFADINESNATDIAHKITRSFYHPKIIVLRTVF